MKNIIKTTEKSKVKVKILRKTDIVLIFVFLIFSVIFYFIFDLNSQTGDTVVIKLNGEIYKEISLDENKDVEIYSKDGILLNTVRILDKKVFIIYADCPDKICEKHKPIDSDSYINDMIVCLPDRITVEIIHSENSGNKDKNKFDIII